jgi:hypothetical protein
MAQKERKLTNGFSISLMKGIPAKTFAALPEDDGFHSFPLHGLQIGNRWYFNPKEKSAAGLLINWLDISLANKGNESFAFDITILEFGPVYTVAINKNIAIDGYYHLRPTFFGRADNKANDDYLIYKGFNFTHAFGAAYRWKALNIALEYHLGVVNGKQASSKGTIELTGEAEKLKINSLQILVGFKF